MKKVKKEKKDPKERIKGLFGIKSKKDEEGGETKSSSNIKGSAKESADQEKQNDEEVESDEEEETKASVGNTPSSPVLVKNDLSGTWMVYAPLPSLKDQLLPLGRAIAKDDLLQDKDIIPPEGPLAVHHHITLHQGIVVEKNNIENALKPLRKIMSTTAPFTVVSAELDVFQVKREVNGQMKEYDVLVIRMQSGEKTVVKTLHDKIGSTYRLTWAFPSYKPHCTIAWLKQGKGKAYIDKLTKEVEKLKITAQVSSVECCEWMKMAEVEKRIRIPLNQSVSKSASSYRLGFVAVGLLVAAIGVFVYKKYPQFQTLKLK